MNIEQEVTVFFLYGKSQIRPLHQLTDRIRETLLPMKIGELDGHEIATDLSDGYLFLYGPSAEALFTAIRPILNETDFMNKAIVTLRFQDGSDNTSEYEVTL